MPPAEIIMSASHSGVGDDARVALVCDMDTEAPAHRPSAIS
jgi:hypothetical protein